MPSYIEIQGIDKLLAKVGRFETIQVLTDPMVRSLAKLNSFMVTYPRQTHKPQGWKSQKQRRWFFWALREGIIQVPYIRTGLLGRSWQMSIHNDGATLTGVLNNPTPYGPFVQGDSQTQQAAYHQGNWRTTDLAIERLGETVENYFAAAIEAALRQ